MRCYVFSVLFYNVETLTLTEATSRELKVVELFSKTSRVENEAILERKDLKKSL